MRQTYGRDFMTVFPDALRGLARDRNAGPTALRVLIWAWNNLDWEKFGLITQEDVAAELCMSSAAVRKGLRRLLAEGILERQGKGARQQWRVTQEASWFGGAERYNKVLVERATEPEAAAILAAGRARRRRAA
jgi:hypothetical protein